MSAIEVEGGNGCKSTRARPGITLHLARRAELELVGSEKLAEGDAASVTVMVRVRQRW